MKITIISYDNWGLNQKVVDHLQQNGYDVTHINFHSFQFKYSSPIQRIYNVILKTFFKKNLKNIFYGKEILKKLNLNKQQDLIITIKADFIDPEYIHKIKTHSKKTVAFFNDSSKRCPKIKRVCHLFDKSYSFEKDDCKNLKMSFLTNWIFTKSDIKSQYLYEISNVSSMDKRFNILNSISSQLKEMSIKYKFIVLKNKKNYKSESLEIVKNKLSLEEINQLNKESQTLLDINRANQSGLSFRVFECLGYHKKLITTNEDIKNYDFYNPSNILIINKDNPIIDPEFFNKKYESISENIYYKYTINGWFKEISK